MQDMREQISSYLPSQQKTLTQFHFIFLSHRLQRSPNINPWKANIFNWNFHPLEVVYRWRDSQLQVDINDFEILLIDVTFNL